MIYRLVAVFLFMLSASASGSQFYTTHPLLNGTPGLETLTGAWVLIPTAVAPYGEIESYFEISENHKSQFIATLTDNPKIHCKLNSAKIAESLYLVQFKLPANLSQPKAGSDKTEYFSYFTVQLEKQQLRLSQLDALKFSSHLKSKKVDYQIFKDDTFGHRIHGDTKRIAAELKKNILKFSIDEEIYCRSDQLKHFSRPLKTSMTTDRDGYESYAEYRWYDNAVAIVESQFNLDGDHCWAPNRVKTGQASVVYLKWGGHHPESTGGGYTIVQIQMPKTVSKSQEFELRPPNGTRTILSVKSRGNRNVSELTTAEIALIQFGNPIGKSMASNHTGFEGQVKILEIEKKFITIELTLKKLSDFQIGANKRVFKLARMPAESAR